MIDIEAMRLRATCAVVEHAQMLEYQPGEGGYDDRERHLVQYSQIGAADVLALAAEVKRLTQERDEARQNALTAIETTVETYERETRWHAMLVQQRDEARQDRDLAESQRADAASELRDERLRHQEAAVARDDARHEAEKLRRDAVEGKPARDLLVEIRAMLGLKEGDSSKGRIRGLLADVERLTQERDLARRIAIPALAIEDARHFAAQWGLPDPTTGEQLDVTIDLSSRDVP